MTDILSTDNKNHLFRILSTGIYDRILELGPYDGRDSVYLAKLCRELVCIEGRQCNIDTTTKAIGDAKNVSVVLGNLEEIDLKTFGRFDVVWAVGVLYHMPNPWDLAEKITKVTNVCFGWSHLSEILQGTKWGYGGREYKEFGIEDPLSGLSAHSWWLTPVEFLRMWRDLGWMISYLDEPSPHKNGGLHAQFITWRP